MMSANSHFCTLRYPGVLYTILFTLCRSLLKQQIELVINIYIDYTFLSSFDKDMNA